MTRLSRAARRIVVIGAVAALGAVLVAPSASAGNGENGNNNLDPPGVDVPGWEAEKVSGEAEGCYSEYELTIDFSVINGSAGGDVSTANEITAEAFNALPSADAGNIPGVGYLGTLLDAAQSEVEQYLSEIGATEEGEDPPGTEILHQEVGPLPSVEIPWQGGGPVVDDEEECEFALFGIAPLTLTFATDLRVESEGLIGPAGYSHTESESHDNFGIIYTADKIDSECLATLEDIDAKTDIDDGEYLFVPDDVTNFAAYEIRDIPENPDENEELVDVDFSDPTLFGGGAGLDVEFSLVANEQEETDKAVDVYGIHSELLISITVGGQPFISLTTEGFRDFSHCDIHPIPVAVEPIVVEPKFTG